MVRKTQRMRVDRQKAGSYAAAADEFLRSADLAAQNRSWNAAGLLLVHAAIAYADAVCIARSGWKSSSDNHMDAATLLDEIVAKAGGRENPTTHLRKILEEKNRAAYTGQSLREHDVAIMRKHADRFVAWTRKELDRP